MGGGQDKVRRVVPIRPYGVPVYVTASGTASSDTTAWVEPPKDMPLGSPTMQIIIGPTVRAQPARHCAWTAAGRVSLTRVRWHPGSTLPPAI